MQTSLLINFYFYHGTNYMAHRDEFLGQNINVSAMLTVGCARRTVFGYENQLTKGKLLFRSLLLVSYR